MERLRGLPIIGRLFGRGRPSEVQAAVQPETAAAQASPQVNLIRASQAERALAASYVQTLVDSGDWGSVLADPFFASCDQSRLNALYAAGWDIRSPEAVQALANTAMDAYTNKKRRTLEKFNHTAQAGQKPSKGTLWNDHRVVEQPGEELASQHVQVQREASQPERKKKVKRKVFKFLEAQDKLVEAGFEIIDTNASYIVYKHPGGYKITVNIRTNMTRADSNDVHDALDWAKDH